MVVDSTACPCTVLMEEEQSAGRDGASTALHSPMHTHSTPTQSSHSHTQSPGSHSESVLHRTVRICHSQDFSWCVGGLFSGS